MNVIIINQPFGNRGDESAHRALIRNLASTYPESKLELVTLGNAVDMEKLIKDFQVESPNMSYSFIPVQKGINTIAKLAFRTHLRILLNANSTIRALKQKFKTADMVVCAPGGICMGGFMNWTHVLSLMIAKSMNKPIVYYGRSIGPFPENSSQQKLFNKFSYELLHYMGYISLRDKKSINFAKEWNVNFHPTVDTAFLEKPKVQLPCRVKKQLEGKKYMVMVPNLLTWHHAFAKCSQGLIDKFFVDIIKGVLDKDPSIYVVMLPQLHNFSYSDDKYYFDSLLERIGDDRVEIIDDMYGSDIQQTIISSAEYVIGARYHSIVFAINQACPFVSLSYEHKMSGLLENLDIKNAMVDITDIFDNENHVSNAVSEVLEKIKVIPERKSHCVEWRERAQEMAKESYRLFNDYLDRVVK